MTALALCVAASLLGVATQEVIRRPLLGGAATRRQRQEGSSASRPGSMR